MLLRPKCFPGASTISAISGSYEDVCHQTGKRSFLLNLRLESGEREFRNPRLERAIGVIYRPETELASHYFQAVLPEQFDEFIWFTRPARSPRSRRKRLRICRILILLDFE